MPEWFWTPFFTKQLHKCPMNQAGFVLASWPQETNQHTPPPMWDVTVTAWFSACRNQQSLCFRICDTGPYQCAPGDTWWGCKKVSFQLLVLGSFLRNVGFGGDVTSHRGWKGWTYESLVNFAEYGTSDRRQEECRTQQAPKVIGKIRTLVRCFLDGGNMPTKCQVIVKATLQYEAMYIFRTSCCFLCPKSITNTKMRTNVNSDLRIAVNFGVVFWKLRRISPPHVSESDSATYAWLNVFLKPAFESYLGLHRFFQWRLKKIINVSQATFT